jgi:hypothetical protein
VAVLHLHAAVTWLRNDCTILAELRAHNRSIAVFIPSQNGLANVLALAMLGSELRRTP